MTKPMAGRTALLLPVLLAVAACGSGDQTPGSVSPSEAQQMNDAADMLDANSVDINAVEVDGENEAQPQ